MLEILYEDKEIIVVKKPVGMESQASSSFAPDMVSEIKKYIYNLSTKSGEPYVGVIHRLDKPVGGVMVYAKTPKAAAALSTQIQAHQMRKLYKAVACGRIVDNVDNFVDYMLKDRKSNLSKIVEKGIIGAKRAELRYRVVDKVEKPEPLVLVEVELFTGRHHQIRVQFAAHGLPLWGDTRYNPAFAQKERGSQRGVQESVALWAWKLVFFHPITGEAMSFTTEPEGPTFEKLMSYFGKMVDNG